MYVLAIKNLQEMRFNSALPKPEHLLSLTDPVNACFLLNTTPMLSADFYNEHLTRPCLALCSFDSQTLYKAHGKLRLNYGRLSLTCCRKQTNRFEHH